jgi:hypothetical protein
MRASFPYLVLLFTVFGCSSGSSASKSSTDGGTQNGAGGAPNHGGNCPDAAALSGGAAPKTDTIPMPGGETGIGFDDLIYSTRLHRMLVPGGWTGRVNLVNPDTLEVTSISGFSAEASWTEGDDTKGVGCVDEGNGLVFVGDRTTWEVGVVDPAQRKILTKVKLAGYPDYLRYVESTGELWVSEPLAGQIEVMKGAKDGNPVQDALIPFPGGLALAPQALVIDQTRGLALTMHLAKGEVVAIDVKARQELGPWPTGCASSHGLVAIDEKRGYLFPGCLDKARVAVLDLNNGGALLDSFELGAGSALVAFSSKLNHFYLRGDPGTPLAFLGVSNGGKLRHLSTFDMTFAVPQKPAKAHCLAADDLGGVWSCDSYAGTILRYRDSLPSCSE